MNDDLTAQVQAALVAAVSGSPQWERDMTNAEIDNSLYFSGILAPRIAACMRAVAEEAEDGGRYGTPHDGSCIEDAFAAGLEVLTKDVVPYNHGRHGVQGDPATVPVSGATHETPPVVSPTTSEIDGDAAGLQALRGEP